MINYTNSLEGIAPENLKGFFENWPKPPSPETHLKVLNNSDYVVLAINETGSVIGFITAITDKILCAYIPFLEVLPEFRQQGIGTELMKRMIDELKGYYMVDLLCDSQMQAYYEQFGMKKAVGMMIRNYEKQSGKKD